MIAPNFKYGLGQAVLSPSKKNKGAKDIKTGFKDNQVVEQYEGECEECEREVKEKSCPICES